MTRNSEIPAIPSAKAALPVRLGAALAIAWERFWPLVVPAVCVVLAFLIVSWLGLWRIAPGLLRYLALVLFLAALGFALYRLRWLRWPQQAEINRRIEARSSLSNRPLTAQSDAIAFGGDDPLARALWHEHRSRMAQNLKNLTGGGPQADANRIDPWAMRAFLATAAFAAFGFSLGPGGGRMSDAFAPRIDTAQLLSRLDAWVNPPVYTRKPPIYLSGRNKAGEAVDDKPVGVPQGSEIFLRFVGDERVTANFQPADGSVAVKLQVPEAAGKIAPQQAGNAANIIEYTAKLTKSGVVTLLSGGTAVAQWRLDVIADLPPSIAMSELPTAALSGSLQLAYEMSDDYGVVAARGLIVPLGGAAPGARPLVGPPDLPLALPRQRAVKGAAKINRDLTQHPWAGARVTLTLEAQDDAGQKGRSQPHMMVLPGRQFNNPLALALVEQRRILALDANQQQRVADLLDATMVAPDEFIKSAATYAAMKSAFRRIVDARNDDNLRSALDLLWDIALAVEFGDLSEAEAKLRDAQEKLSDALARNAPDAEIQKLMQELRQAMNELMQQLTREAMENPARQSPLDENALARTLRQRDLEKMLDQIENLARSGSRDSARQMLSELQRMMDNLRAGRHQQQKQAEGNQMNQALDQLSELMRQQQQLLDETFKMQQQQKSQGGNQPQDGQQQQNGQNGQQPQPGKERGEGQDGEPMSPEEFAEALKNLQQQQEALQQQLGKLGEELEGLGLDPSQPFGEAGREMGEAGKNLGQGQAGEATGNQGQALEALQRGVQQMLQQMAGDRQQGGQQPGEGQAGQDRNRSDPLGRNQQANGLEDGDNTKVPDEIEAQRAREIMEAIRRRLGRPDGPLIEKRYLERLLEPQ